jgi:hypothetical protein
VRSGVVRRSEVVTSNGKHPETEVRITVTLRPEGDPSIDVEYDEDELLDGPNGGLLLSQAGVMAINCLSSWSLQVAMDWAESGEQ